MKSETNSRRVDILGSNRKSDQEIYGSVLKHWKRRFGYWSVFAAVPAVLASQLHVSRTVDARQPESTVTGLDARSSRKQNLCSTSRSLLKRQSEFRLPHQNANQSNLAQLGEPDDCPGRAIPPGSYTAANPFVESGDTTGANNTIRSAYFYCAYAYVDLPGPDHVYSFTISDKGANPRIEISTSSNTYKPIAYVLPSETQCPSGTGNHFSFIGCSFNPSFPMNLSFLPTNVPIYVFIDSVTNEGGPYTIRMQDVTIVDPPCDNRIECPDFFVTQHYRDFLNREPDAPGLAHWTGEITECNDPVKRHAGESFALCTERKRANTSAAFFFSPEFQNTGSFILRVYWGTLGKSLNAQCPGVPMGLLGHCRPLYSEYIADMATITQGIVVNDALDPARINANKQAFVAAFVQRPDFRAVYDALNNTQFVDRLFQTTGIAPSSGDRQALIDGLNSGAETRASVVFKIVDGTTTTTGGLLIFNTTYGQAFYNQEFDTTFVMMEYLGYLRRNPDQDGYNFWLAKLRQYGNWVDAQLVLAFIISPEYRSRFRP